MATDYEVFEKVRGMIRYKIPGFEILFKNESYLQKFIGFFVKWFNPNFMTAYITTLGTRVYFPSRQQMEASYGGSWRVLAHEYVHMWRNKKIGIFYDLHYLYPQILSVFSFLALGAFWSLWMLGWLVFLLWLAPWPIETGRADEEYRAYTIGLALSYWIEGEEAMQAQVEWVVPIFTGSSYYYMWKNEKDLRAHFEKTKASIRDGTFLNGKDAEPYRDLWTTLQPLGILRNV